jgi:hypothetical protein
MIEGKRSGMVVVTIAVGTAFVVAVAMVIGAIALYLG